MTLAALAKAQATAFLIGALDNAATLDLGDTLEAQVLRVLPEGRASLLIGRTSVDVTLSPEVMAQANLKAGSLVTLRVDTGGANPRLALLSVTPGAEPSVATSAQQPATVPAGESGPPHPAVAARETALRHLGGAPAAQDGLSPLFASLVEARQSAALPPLILQVLGAITSLRVPVEALGDAGVLRDAVARSGVFHEASAQAGGGVPRADLKGALSALQRLLQIWEVVTGPPASTGAGHSAAGARPAASAPFLPDAQAGDGTAPRPDTGAAQAGAARAAAAATPASLLAHLAGLAGDLGETTPAPAPSFRGPAASPAEGQIASERPAPPRRDAHPQAQPVAPAPAHLAQAESSSLVATLLERTEAALDRLKLTQVASLPTPAEVPRADMPPPQHWHVEIPLALGRETPVLALEVERDGAGQGGRGESGERIWRLRFALDLEPLGPVHAVLTLQGHDVGVSLWAEREGTSRMLRGHADELRAALAREAFVPTLVDVATGTPPQRIKPAGHFLDRRT